MRALIEAAERVFARDGYEQATTRAVAAEAGCSEGLIHRYFGGKSGLLAAVFQGRSDATSAWRGTPVGDDLHRDVVWLLRAEIDELWQERDFIRIAVSRALIDGMMGALVGEKLAGSRTAAIEARLRVHLEAGRIHPAAYLPAAAYTISSTAFALGFLGRAVFGWQAEHVDGLADSAGFLIARGLAA